MQEKLSSILSSYKGRKEELIPMLQQVQEEFGYLPEETMLAIARFAGVPESKVYAIATFYTQFRFTPIGETHVMVCCGTACYVRGAQKVLEMVSEHLGISQGQATEDMSYSLESVACIGACGLAPCIMVNRKVHAKITLERISELLPKPEASKA